jgi:RNA polymerase sigma-70 factor, ECF subfamily
MAAVSPLGRASGVEQRELPADALTGLYERHAGRVFQYCLNWLRSREEAEDAAQTTFLYAYRGLDRGVVPTYERPWLLSIARNVCLSRTDAARRRAVEVAQDPHALEEIIAAPAPSSELDGLRDALAMLTEQQRHAIVLREWHGLSYSEIAERLELSQAAVETLLFRARRSLARRLRQPLGIGSFLPWLRSLAEGGAAKIALGAAAVAVTATTGAVTITPHAPAPPQAVRTTDVVPSAPAERSIAARPHRVVKHRVAAKHHVAAAPRVVAAPVTAPRSEAQPQQQQPTAPAKAPADDPVALAPAAPAPVAPVPTINTSTPTTSTTTTEVAAPAVDTVTNAATTVTNTVSNVVNNTTDAVANTAAAVATTAQNAIAAVTSLIPVITGPKLP